MFGIDDLAAAGLKLITDVVDRVIPDPSQAAQIKLQVLQLQQTGELAKLTAETNLIQLLATSDQAQVDLDKTENTEGFFHSGWRPLMAWICVAAFFWNYIVIPITIWNLKLFGFVTPIPPILDMSVMAPALFGMLGLTTARTYEKIQGIK